MTTPFEKQPLAIVGIGNTFAGDDGAGVEVVRRLEKIRNTGASVFLHVLEGDHFEIADFLDRAERFIFVDAVEGERPGELVTLDGCLRACAPSFHQTDISAVMRCLEEIGIVDSFPRWEIWGITILPPSEIGEGLSPEVDTAVGLLCDRLREEIVKSKQE